MRITNVRCLAGQALLLGWLVAGGTCSYAQFGNVLQRTEKAVTNRANSTVNQGINRGINKGINKAEKGIKNGTKKQPDSSQTVPARRSDKPATARTTNATSVPIEAAPAQPASLRSYTNYAFLPGDAVLFDDDARTDQESEMAGRWNLLKGQAARQRFGDEVVMAITDGNSGYVTPLIEPKHYLPPAFTIEYDYYQTPGAHGLFCWLNDADKREVMAFTASHNGASIKFQTDGEKRKVNGVMPAEITGTNFDNRWHHVAFSRNGRTLKLYVDQFLIITVPNNTAVPASVDLGGIADPANPILFKNVRIAAGGDPAEVSRKLSGGKYVAYGIRFDAGQATIKPESMGEINAVYKFLSETRSPRFEIGCYSDIGDAALTQQQADAVKAQLVSMGVDAKRLRTKGYGAAKPTDDAATSGGNALTSRVEFVKR